jgi:hypothetical protein
MSNSAFDSSGCDGEVLLAEAGGLSSFSEGLADLMAHSRAHGMFLCLAFTLPLAARWLTNRPEIPTIGSAGAPRRRGFLVRPGRADGLVQGRR